MSKMHSCIGDLEEEVCMDIPPGFKTSVKDEYVCKLQKALYDTISSSMVWTVQLINEEERLQTK